jgi:hypothetical protein
MKEKNKKHKVWFALGIIVFVIYVVFTATRYSEHTLFTPFTGRVFDIDAEELACLTLKSGIPSRIFQIQKVMSFRR